MKRANRTDFCIAPRLKKARSTAGIDQIQLAKRLHVSVKTLRLWERGDKDIPFQQVINWAYECNVPFEYLALGRLPLRNALGQLELMHTKNIAAATNALNVALRNAEEMMQSYRDSWAVDFEDYSLN